ncbi:hypothetical protein NQZ68_030915 [Dissostichus eleginoides]|nr:hypothetical protein NQZ68_030915 [Dissostichus eleginoides]
MHIAQFRSLKGDSVLFVEGTPQGMLQRQRGVSLSEHHPFTKTTHGISVSLTDLAVCPHLSLGAPSAGSGHRKLSTQGSSSHYAHLKPGCRANQWPVHEDAITTGC